MRGLTGRSGFAVAMAFFMAMAGALAGQTLVVTSDDQADAGGLTETLAAAADGDVIRFAPGVGAVLTTTVASLAAPNLTITGNVNQDGDPDTVIRGGGGTVFAAPVIAWTGAGSHAAFENLHFKDFAVAVAGNFNGGGILSLSSTNDVVMGDLVNLGFTGNAVDATGSVYGGGLVGEFSGGTANIGSVSGQFGSVGGGNTVTVAADILGGGVVGVFGWDYSSIGDITGSASFAGNSITTSGSIRGGGLAGAFAFSGNASVGDIAATASFTGNTIEVEAGNIIGGGLVGAYSSSGKATIGSVSGQFGSAGGGNTVTVNGIIQGGGVVGVFGSGGSSIGDITASASFAGNTIETQNENLEGGGVVGAYSFGGKATIGSVSGQFGSGGGGGNTVTVAKDILGGGVVGAYSTLGTATIGDVSGQFGGGGGGNTVTAARDIQGGGVVGVRGDGDADIGDITESASFAGNTIESQIGNVSGGGVVGAYSENEEATIGSVSGQFGSGSGGGNAVTVNGDIAGGGVVGVYGYGDSGIGDITASASFAGNTIKSRNGGLSGGGVVGAYSTLGTAAIGSVSGQFGSGSSDGNAVTVNGDIAGGGVVGVYGYGDSGIGDITGSASFAGNTITTNTGYLYGGGVVGAYSKNGTATIGSVSGQFGSGDGGGNAVTVNGDIAGGGVVGVYGYGDANIGDITASASFAGNSIESENGTLLGGGVVGAYSVSGTATIGSVSGQFGDGGGGNTVTAGRDILGGGVVGVSGYGDSNIGDITASASFAGNTIESQNGALQGGGVVGAYSFDGTATIGDVSGQFGGGSGGGGGNTVTVAVDIRGGGVVGVYGDGDSNIGDITESASFAGNTIEAQNRNLSGGGVVGAYSADGTATIGSVSGQFGSAGGGGNTVTVVEVLYGGGVVGVYGDGDADIGDITASASFAGNIIESRNGSSLGISIQGGGVVGAYSESEEATIGSVSGRFGGGGGGNTVTVYGSIQGGGVVGVRGHGDASIGDITGSASFAGNTITTSMGSVQGGGVVGAHSVTGAATIGDVSGQFGSGGGGGNTVTASRNIAGGGVVGVYGSGDSGIGDITASASFVGNTIEAENGTLSGGGVVGAYSANGKATIGDVSGQFGSVGGGGNAVTAAADIQGGGVVGVYGYDDSDIGDITASASFAGNTIETQNENLEGGGVVGAYSTFGTAAIGSVSGQFGSGSGGGNTVTVAKDILGGGVVGAYSTLGTATIGDVSGQFGGGGGGNTVTAARDIQGGGVVGVRGDGDADIGDITESASFVGNTIEAENGTLSGGGVVGAYSANGKATIGDVSGQFGSVGGGGNAVTAAADIQGGGVVGVYGYDDSDIGDITASASFAGNTIESQTESLYGGGVVGVFSAFGKATIGSVSGQFGSGSGGGNTVTVYGDIAGGGVVGVYSFYGDSNIGDITGSASFAGNTITTSMGFLQGGGVVGAHSVIGAATIGDVSGQFGSGSGGGGGNTVTASQNIAGGGVVGVYGSGDSGIGDITESASFAGNTIESQNGGLYGGGVVGAYSATGTATIGDVSGRFGGGSGGGGGNTVTVAVDIQGGGVVGVHGNGDANIGDIMGSASFAGNTITTSMGFLQGGGVVGAHSVTGAATIGDVSGQFGSGGGGGNTVTAALNIQGGGVVGVYGFGDSGIGDITASASFAGNTIEAENGTLQGGGVVGAYSFDGTATIGDVSGRFGGQGGDGNTVTIGTSLHGGGLVGTYSENYASGTVGAVTGASFVENRVTVGSETATDDVFGHGGVLGFAGLAKPLTIENSRFEKNSLVVYSGNNKTPQDMAAAVFVDTARTGLDAGVTAHTVVLRADAGKELVFSENSQTVGGVTSNNAILFGRDRHFVTGSQTLNSLENAALDVRAAADGTILLEDAVLVDMNNGKSFAMTVANAAGSTFRWGGDNRWRVDAGGTARLDLENADGRTEFLGDFVLRPENGTVLDLSVAAGHTLAVGIGERTATQAFFDLNDAGAGSTVAIGSGARIEPTVNGVRFVRSLDLADRYLIASGLGADDFLALLLENSSRLVEFGPLESDASGVWLPVTNVVDPASFYNSSPNAVALAPLVDDVFAGHDIDMTEDEYIAFLTSLPDLAPENVLAMPHFALAATDRFRDTALRQTRLPLIRRPGDMARAALLAGGDALASLPASGFPDLTDLTSLSGGRFWAGYVHDRERLSGHGGYRGYRQSTDGGFIGYSHYFRSGWEAGVYGGISKGDVTARSGARSEVTTHGRHVGGYGRLTLRNGFSVTGDVLYSHYDNDSDRRFNTSRVHSEFSQRVVGGGVEARWDLNPGCGLWTVAPFASLRVNHYNQGASREGGDALWAVNASSESGTVWSGTAGAEAGYDFILANAVVSPRLRAAYRRDGGDTSVSRRVSLAGAPGSVVIHGVRPGKDNLLLGASLEAAFRTRAGILDVRVGYDLSVRRRSTGHGISVTAGLAF